MNEDDVDPFAGLSNFGNQLNAANWLGNAAQNQSASFMAASLNQLYQNLAGMHPTKCPFCGRGAMGMHTACKKLADNPPWKTDV